MQLPISTASPPRRPWVFGRPTPLSTNGFWSGIPLTPPTPWNLGNVKGYLGQWDTTRHRSVSVQGSRQAGIKHGGHRLATLEFDQHLRLVSGGWGDHRYGPRLTAPVGLLGIAYLSGFSKIQAIENQLWGVEISPVGYCDDPPALACSPGVTAARSAASHPTSLKRLHSPSMPTGATPMASVSGSR